MLHFPTAAGNTNNTTQVYVNGVLLGVAVNLGEALRHLPAKGIHRILADVLCLCLDRY